MAEALAAAFTDNILTCSICLEEYEDPRMLSCYHTFCLVCISDHAKRTITRNRTFQCPVCREDVQFPAGGLSKFKKNFAFCKAKDIINQQQTERGAPENVQTNVEAATQVVAKFTNGCEKHPGNELKYYCEEDDTVVCGDCALTDHYRHGILPVEKAEKSNSENIKTALVKTKVNVFKEAVVKEATIEFEGYREASAAGLEAMLGQVTVLSKPTLSGQVTNPMSETNLPVFLKKAECVHSFTAKLKHDKGNFIICGLAIDEQFIYVTLLINDKTKVRVFTHAGLFMFDIKLNTPFHVAVSQTGKLYITSIGDKCVKVYSTTGKQVTTMGQSQLEEPTGITLNRHGYVMVCDAEKKSIFTFRADTGQLLNTIPLTACECPTFITVNGANDNIVISDVDTYCVHVLSPTGDQLYQYGTKGSGDGQLDKPCGVCVDRYGHIFIADCYNNRVVGLSPQGQFIKHIATEDDGLEYPIGLSINPAGLLVVAEGEGKVKTLQYLQ
ncbi:tripartite motif-containing protein 3-like [Lingula anatina]|uniref:Tripartite motif-containing protein 3-like n=1 Tax=Lingula anatina TaxID=7574 RepID=A0A1S3IX01_LINAN|nr:tripartite motif-containing protein 3-like [Lingula anatina]|eukprot:XP_013402727.1 tripartite motif-containing protein 3-like [Lingula anatina]